MSKECIHDIISRVWGWKWNYLPIDLRVNLRYKYSRTIANRTKRGKNGIIDAEQQTQKDK